MRTWFQLVGLFAIAVAKPLFDLFARNSTYFFVNSIQVDQLYLWVASLALLIPTALALLIAASRRVDQQLAEWLKGFCFAALFAAFFLQLGGRAHWLPESATLVLALAGSLLTAWWLIRRPSLAFGLELLAPLGIVFPILFFSNIQILKFIDLRQAEASIQSRQYQQPLPNKPLIVFVLLDEFSLIDILDSEGDIDEKRFPNFAAFARESIWYPNALTVSDDTRISVPAILSGRLPSRDAQPVLVDHPRNLFTLLDGQYTVFAVETMTHLNRSGESWRSMSDLQLTQGGFRLLMSDTALAFLHEILPGTLSSQLPPVQHGWGRFWQTGGDPRRSNDTVVTGNARSALQARQTFLDSFQSGDRGFVFESFIQHLEFVPTTSVNFLHLLLPHSPASYLPNGKKYAIASSIPGAELPALEEAWDLEEPALSVMYQRHLLQVAYTDHLWGELIGKLKRTKRFDEALIVLVADHGVNFEPGALHRRFTRQNAARLAFVPMYIKPPGHRGAVKNEQFVLTTDILPTIIDLLGATPGWSLDGTSLLDPRFDETDRRMAHWQHATGLDLSNEELLEAKRKSVQSQAERLRLKHPNSSLFHFQPGLELLGKRLSDTWSAPDSCVVESIPFEHITADWPRIENLPQMISGDITCAAGGDHPLLIAITADEEIFGMAEPWPVRGGWKFAYVFPEFSQLKHVGRFDLRLILAPSAKSP